MLPSATVLKMNHRPRRDFILKHFIRSVRGDSGSTRKKHPVIDTSKTPRFTPPDNETMRLLKHSANFSDLKSPAMLEDPWTAKLYPKTVIKNTAEEDSDNEPSPPAIDPALASIILFPGQGSQYVGMGAELLKRNSPKVKSMFDNASQILRYDLAKVCTAGPSKELNKTVHCQPAIFVCSMAALERLKHEKPSVIENCVGTAGFSVGEYAALVFAGSLTFEDALKLIKIRAEGMQRASETTSSGLMTVFLSFKSKLPLAISGAKQWVKEQRGYEPTCSVANYLFTECKVIGGDDEALRFIENNASKFHIKCKRVPVSGAFHTALMKPAAEEFRSEISKTKIKPPLIDVYSNLDGKPYSKKNPGDIARRLVKQIYLPVRWEQTLHSIYDRDFFAEKFPRTFECGPGNHLGIMLKKTHVRAYNGYNSFFENFDERSE